MLLDLISPRNFTHRHKLRTSLLCEHLRSACYFAIIKSKYPSQTPQHVFFTNGQQHRFALAQQISVTVRVVHGMVPGNTVWTYVGFEDGTSRLVQSLQRSLTTKNLWDLPVL